MLRRFFKRKNYQMVKCVYFEIDEKSCISWALQWNCWVSMMRRAINSASWKDLEMPDETLSKEKSEKISQLRRNFFPVYHLSARLAK